ncbi:hypothetical protein F4803DRAFT_14638 [Xylaria telfairii]|nr:hypothetical protein F4803DRAFT_14638 [Xylaria telfairii]
MMPKCIVMVLFTYAGQVMLHCGIEGYCHFFLGFKVLTSCARFFTTAHVHTLPYPTTYLPRHHCMHVCGVRCLTMYVCRLGDYMRCIYNPRRLKCGCKASGFMHSNVDKR